MGLFETAYLGWHAVPNEQTQRMAEAIGVKMLYTNHWTPADQFGNQSWDQHIEAFKPHVVISLGDPWMCEHIGVSQHRKGYLWIAYTPIDRDTVSKPWLGMLKEADVLLLYSQFGVDVVNTQMPFRHPELILHGVDRSIFKPHQVPGVRFHDAKYALKNQVLGPNAANAFVVGFVGRNQMRKNIPAVFNVFKAFNCQTWINRETVEIQGDDGAVADRFETEDFCYNKQKFRCDLCPAFKQRQETAQSILYLHTTRGNCSDRQDGPGIGWRIDEIAKRYQLDGRIWMTPNITALSGLPREHLAKLFQCFDIHLHATHSEGFGLTIAETMACGVPNLVTDYSSMPELVADGGGETIDVIAFSTFVTWENNFAHIDIGDGADKLNKYLDDDYREKQSIAAANNRYVPDWDQVAHQFKDLILKLVGT